MIVIVKTIIIKKTIPIEIIIIKIKMTIAVIMKTTIVLKLIKIVVQSHNPKLTSVQLLTMLSKKFKKNFWLPKIAASSATQAGYQKPRPSHTLFNIKTKGSHSFQGTSPIIFSFKRVRWISFVNKSYWDISYKTIMVAAAKKLM